MSFSILRDTVVCTRKSDALKEEINVYRSVASE